MSDATIFVRYVAEGFHAWPDAPDRRSYLRHRHRHLFHIEARCTVSHDERQVEFHDTIDRVASIWAEFGCYLRSQSCETLARRIAARLAEWEPRPWTVSVSEDGEAGAIVTSG